MNNDLIQAEIAAIERELRDLKTVQGPIVNILGYKYSYYLHSYRENTIFKITYIKGDQPLILIPNPDGGIFDPIPLAVVDNVQYLAAAIFGGQVDFYSNWEIVSIERLD